MSVLLLPRVSSIACPWSMTQDLCRQVCRGRRISSPCHPTEIGVTGWLYSRRLGWVGYRGLGETRGLLICYVNGYDRYLRGLSCFILQPTHFAPPVATWFFTENASMDAWNCCIVHWAVREFHCHIQSSDMYVRSTCWWFNIYVRQ